MTVADANVSRRKMVAGAAVGNVLEFYDFASYAFAATIIATQFFPSQDPIASLAASFAAFGVGFLTRPLGAFVIGRVADKRGRKPALLLTFGLMGLSTVLIGLLPTYAVIGVAAPVFLVGLRLLQGFAAGGEWGSSLAFIVEWAPEKRRGVFGSFGIAAIICGTLLGSGVAALISAVLEPEAMQSWGWRLPFLIGGLIIPLGLYLRKHLEETPIHRAASTGASRLSNGDLLKKALQLAGLFAAPTVATQFLNFMAAYIEKFIGLSHATSLGLITLGSVILMLAIPLCGMVSDRLGRKPMLLSSFALLALSAYPMLLMMDTFRTPLVVGAGLIVFNLFCALSFGCVSATAAELFDRKSRGAWLGTSYGILVAILGGTTPYLSTKLVAWTGSPTGPAALVILAAVISFAVIASVRETAFRPLS